MNFLKSKKIIALLVLTLLSFSGISYAKDEGKVFVVTIGSCSGTDQLSLVNNVLLKKVLLQTKELNQMKDMNIK